MNIRKNIIDKITNRKETAGLKEVGSPHLYFGKNTFNEEVQKKMLKPDVYKKFQQTIKEFAPLDAKIAKPIAEALKNWAIANGATHYSHWFQPLTGNTAEKHDAFFSLDSSSRPIVEFSVSQLIQGEPDASSFPSGGIRQTFEARGYTVWDSTSPAFISSTSIGKVLCIPTAFISYSGEALDMKTPLLRSLECLNKVACKLLKTLGRDVSRVYSTVGIEQEFFLVDAAFFNQRPDLIASGRTLYGHSPLKGQELADHFFGTINSRVLEFLQDSERELYELGVPIKTRHNEVAPNQFEVAQIFENANLAIDHNLLIMSVMKNSAARHGFRLLTHEKPFKGINGSGKHCNWSLADSDGNNLLEPGKTPQQNLVFMTCLAGMIRALDKSAELLRISIASLSNDHRLGGFEAPPAILSVFLGDQLSALIDEITSDKEVKKNSSPKHLRIGVATMPQLPLDNSDRNRTCPFAFTGNKFEFRAVGSKQNAAAPNLTLNIAVAEAFDHIDSSIKEKLDAGVPFLDAINQVISTVIKNHKRVVFNGDGYSDEWQKEAKKRGLPNLKSLVDCVPRYSTAENIELLKKFSVLNEREIISRQNVRISRFNIEVMIEVRSMIEIAKTMIIPAAMKYQSILTESIAKAENYGAGQLQKETLKNLVQLINDLLAKLETLETESAKTKKTELELARHLQDKVRPAMTNLRAAADNLELNVDDSLWPMPKYREMLSII